MKRILIGILGAAAIGFGQIPIGWYTNRNLDYLNTMNSQNYTFILRYYNVVPPETDQDIIYYLNTANERYPNLKFLVQIKPALIEEVQRIKNSGTGSYSLQLDTIRTFVDSIRTKPNVAGWYLADEPSNVPHEHPFVIEISTLMEIYNLIKSDSSLPIYIAETWAGWNKRETINSKNYTYADACDVGMVDFYPFLEGQTGELPDDSKKITEAIQCMKKAYKASGKPENFYVVLQGYGSSDWSDTHLTFGRRDPSENEIQYQTYSSLIQGAKGILYWAWYRSNLTVTNRIRKLQTKMNSYHIPDIFDTKPVNDFISVSDTSDSDNNKIRDIHYQLHYYYQVSSGQGSYYLFVANDCYNTKTVTFSPIFPVSAVTVVDEDRSIDPADNQFTDTFTRYQIHVYKFDRVPNPAEN